MNETKSREHVQNVVNQFLGEQPEIVEIVIELIERYPLLNNVIPNILKTFLKLIECFGTDHRFFICGNGGSFADSMHISGEMLKSFEQHRKLSDDDKKLFAHLPYGQEVASALEYGFPVIVLGLNHSLFTALENDNSTRYIDFAQELFSLSSKGDVLMGISTSGNARNILYAVVAAKAKGLTTIGLTGEVGGELASLVDIAIKVPAKMTRKVQELHQPVYHTLCSMVETYFFKKGQ